MTECAGTFPVRVSLKPVALGFADVFIHNSKLTRPFGILAPFGAMAFIGRDYLFF